jgi:uncharacterized protein
VSGERECLVDAVRAADWICAHRGLSKGGFQHDADDPSGPYLGDTLSMGRAFLALYAATGNRDWLQKAERAIEFISDNFGSDLGYLTSEHLGALKSQPQLDENVSLARIANLLWHYSGNEEFKKVAERAMRFVAAPGATDRRGYLVAGVLLADQEMTSSPLHVTVVGRKDDPKAQELFAAAIRQPRTYKRIEWLDEREGPMPNTDVGYPTLPKAAAFLCTDQACSAPVFAVNDLIEKIAKK